MGACTAWQLDAKLSEERLFCHSRVGGNPEVFHFPVSMFLGFRLRGSDEPYCIKLLVREVAAGGAQCLYFMLRDGLPFLWRRQSRYLEMQVQNPLPACLGA